MPVIADEAFAEAVANKAERRKKMLGVVESDERKWPIYSLSTQKPTTTLK